MERAVLLAPAARYSNSKEGERSSTPAQKPGVHESDDSEDEIPLSHRFPPISRLKHSNSSVKFRQGGSALGDGPVNNSLYWSYKRYLPGEVKSANQDSVIKKLKLSSPTTTISKNPTAKAEPKAEEEEDDDDNNDDPSFQRMKWTTLEHNGVMFPPPYKPHGVKMLYKGKPVTLTPEQEEVATMFAAMLDSKYTRKPRFQENFFGDWKKILGRNHVLREERLKQEVKYMGAIVDGVKVKVGNFRVESPGLFRGRGEHPKMGKLRTRIRPYDIIINIGKDAPIPGEKWKEVRHDNTASWLACWKDPINPKKFKYVFLAASKLYAEERKLEDYIKGLNKDPMKKQIAVATYLLDKLVLGEDTDEADTIVCATLKVEDVEPVPPNTLKFDFFRKDSVRYEDEVEVDPLVFRAIHQFRSGKEGSEDLFDGLDTSKLNAHLKELPPCLTEKVLTLTLDEIPAKDEYIYCY
ncbi:OLC1v1007916C1 [Oldenlandia corymbosa var. corymbosa]|uniref:DNA topoisomerase n=1 Tax=Oldenlandia corymbosa var. corymbosa TaxID=529605 RepID=A0AAV1DLV3_OLDCO|nr:OLC1v1007916C1 [Oldenlandia corymbosa var. corymbosa]